VTEVTLVLISSGRGPAECELAVGLYLEKLRTARSDVLVRQADGGKTIKLGGRQTETYRSVLVEFVKDSPPPLGTVCWRCKSPLRPNHGRQNWYIQTSLASDPQDKDPNGLLSAPDGSLGPVRTETFRSPGKGGQNVNKVETGVRIIHLATGLSAESTTHRTQLANRKLAWKRLADKLKEAGDKTVRKAERENWNQHNQLERGNPVEIFTGLNFESESD
jgi:peptide chain release factor